ncbi:MAG: hypothetical protein PHU71_01865 [Candidatus Gracilibacteria bacterium]|nr:hypothetical protein [Candidatus Gracilibacteria bacterium]
MIFLLNAAIYFYFAKIAYQTPSMEVSISNLPQILRYFLNGVFINISRPFTLLNIPSTLIILLGHTIFLLSLFIVWTYKQTIRNFTKIIIFLGGFYVSLFVLISVSRFQFGVEQSYESRYLYYYLIPLVIYFAFIAQNINKSFKYKKTFKVLLSIFLIVFLAGSLIRGYYYKFDREALYVNNYGQLSAFILDSSSQADLSNLHPFSPSQELKDIYLNLIQKPIAEDNSFKELLRENHVFINKLDLEPDSNQAVVVDNETIFYQTFYSPYNNLAGIKFFIPAPYHNPSDSQVLTLYDEGCQQILREVIIKIPRIRYGYLQGIFPYIEKSKEKTFCFSVKPTAAAKINDLSIQLAKPSTYTQGAFILDGNITEKDLFFYPLYQVLSPGYTRNGSSFLFSALPLRAISYINFLSA